MFCISVPVKSNIGYLAAALASLRAQAAPCAVAFLDASGDPAAAAIADASGLAFAWRRHAADAGQAAAIAEGWAHAPGDILGWLNDDDLLLPETLATVAAVFAAEPDIDVVYGHGVMLDAAGAFTGYFPSIADRPAGLRTSNVICQPAAFVRRAAVDRIGGLDTTLHYTMDWDLWLRLYEAGARFRFVDAPLAAVRSHPVTKTRVGGASRWREIETLMAPRLSHREIGRLRLGLRLSAARDNGRRIEAALLATLFALGRGFRPPAGPVRRVLGLDPATGHVVGHCTIVMPVPPDAVTVDLCVEAAGAGALEADADDRHLVVSPNADGANRCQRVRDVPVRHGCVRCVLRGDATGWRLRRVSVCSFTRRGA